MSNIIVMAFSPRNIVGYSVLKNGLQRRGHRHPRNPLATPLSTVTSLFSAGAERADSVGVQFLVGVFGVSLILGRFDRFEILDLLAFDISVVKSC